MRKRICGPVLIAILLSAALLQACGGSKAADTKSTPTPAVVDDPSAPGPYPVGVMEVTFTTTSLTTGEPRVLKTVVWYPAAASAKDAAIDEAVGGARDAEPAREAGPRPIIVWSHGAAGEYPYAFPYNASHLAGYGFVVIAPPHPGNLFADCVTITGCSTEGMTDSYINRPADLTFTLDSMLKLSDNPDSLFYQLLDGSRVGISGHSFGGTDTVRMADTAPGAPFSAALAMAPCVDQVAPPPDKVTMPLMILGGDRDMRCPTSFLQPFFDGISKSLAHFFVVFPHGGHGAYFQECPAPQPPSPLSEYACGPDDLSQDKAHQYINFYATAFFMTYVAQVDGYAAFLAPSANTGDPDVRYSAVVP